MDSTANFTTPRKSFLTNKWNVLDTFCKDICYEDASQENVLFSIANLHGAFFILH